jgi:hypothetical protein
MWAGVIVFRLSLLEAPKMLCSNERAWNSKAVDLEELRSIQSKASRKNID